MLFPPDNFDPAAARQYFWQLGLAPALCVAVAYGWANAVALFLALAVVGVLAGGGAAWLSVFGRRHAILGAAGAWLFLYLPLALAPFLLALRAAGAELWPGILALAGVHLLALAAAVYWHGRHCPLPGDGARQLDWPGTRLDLSAGLIRRRERRPALKLGGAAAALASVPVYQILRPYLDGAPGLAVLALAGNLLFAGLTVATVARPLAQGLRLARLERNRGRFVTESLPELERRRQGHALGRWLRRRWPLQGRPGGAP